MVQSTAATPWESVVDTISKPMSTARRMSSMVAQSAMQRTPSSLRVIERVRDGLAVGARAVGRVERDDVRARSDAGTGVAQRRGDVHALVTVLPQTDHGDLDAAADGGDIRQALAADGGGAAQLAGAGHLGHGLRAAQGLTDVGLHADDQLALQGLNDGVNSHDTS